MARCASLCTPCQRRALNPVGDSAIVVRKHSAGNAVHSPLQAEVFQMDFMVEPAALEDLEHNLKVDERMLRYVLQKKDPLPRLPTTYKVSKLARALRERGALPVRCDVLTSAEPIQQAPACSVSEVLGSLQGKAGI